jgi:hypothetical protein
MNYDNEIEFKYQFLKKKRDRKNRYNSYALISILLFIIGYPIVLINQNVLTSANYNSYFPILLGILLFLGILFIFFKKKADSNQFSTKESLIYYTQNIKNIINSKEYDLIQKNFLKLIEELIEYEKYNDNDLYFDKNRKKIREVLNYLKDYLYPTLIQKNSDGEYIVYSEDNKPKLQGVLHFLDYLTLSLINETFLDLKLDKKDLIYEETDINSIKESSIIINYKNNILKLYDTSLPFRYIINFLVIFFIVYSINQFFYITNISNILTVSAVAAAGMTRSK